MTSDTDAKLGTLRFKTDKEPHILVKPEVCQNCHTKPCILGCPAECFELVNEELRFQYEDCIECGTCKILCPTEAIQWNYPRGTFGVAFRYG
ncbi:MAG: ferredoxin family protein [Candidatus Hodarchaeota archaeon]